MSKKPPPPSKFPLPFAGLNPTPNVTYPPAGPPAGSVHPPPVPHSDVPLSHLGQPPTHSSLPKTTSSYHVTSPTPTHSHFSRPVPGQAPPFPEPSTGHYYNQNIPHRPPYVAQAGNSFQQGQSAASNFTQMPNPMGGGAPAGGQAQQAPVRVPCKSCGSLTRKEGMDASSEFCSEEHRWNWRNRSS